MVFDLIRINLSLVSAQRIAQERLSCERRPTNMIGNPSSNRLYYEISQPRYYNAMSDSVKKLINMSCDCGRSGNMHHWFINKLDRASSWSASRRVYLHGLGGGVLYKCLNHLKHVLESN